MRDAAESPRSARRRLPGPVLSLGQPGLRMYLKANVLKLKARLAKRLDAPSELTCPYRCRMFHTVTTQVATPVQPQRVRAIDGECICSIK